ncbi:MAG: DNA-binding protein [Planctomycetaceae bacterium]|nr:MAG: DNA-binding protein [Planctomycetaceae bacterium]
MPSRKSQTRGLSCQDDHRIVGRIGARMRTLRLQRGWSLEELSAASGVSRSMLSQIERDRANPTLAVTWRIAQAFGMTLGEFVDQPESGGHIQVVRGDDPSQLYRSDDHCVIRTLSPLPWEKDVEMYALELRPGGALRSAPHYQGTRELVTVEQGRLRVTSHQEQRELRKGDSASYRADVPHALENLAGGNTRAILVVVYA